MLFNSYGFIFVYLPVVVAGFFVLARIERRLAAAWLAAASLFFYGWWNPPFVVLLLASVAFNYAMGVAIARRQERPAAGLLLASAIAANLALLGFFKYANFFVGTANGLDGGTRALLDIVLPLGISFFTFTQIAFLVDARRGLAREYDFVHYLLFVTYFPHLIAGPILHHRQVMPQFESPAIYRPRAEDFSLAIVLFTIGLAKKVLVADPLGEYVDPIFAAAANGERPQLIAAWAGCLAYTLQLYFDFSGYSDMAVGLSLFFGVRIPFNFDSPYKAASIVDFWRRWHITLSQFLRDYLYIPLGGNRRGPLRRHANILVTMLLGGLWHGASWTFVAWGGVHGLMLVANHLWRELRARLGLQAAQGALGRMACVGATFVCVSVAWVLFRSESFEAAAAMLRGMAGLNGISLPKTIEGLAWLPRFLVEAASFEGAFGGVETLRYSPFPAFLAGLGTALAIVWLAPNSRQLAERAAVLFTGGAKLARVGPRTVALASALLFTVSVLHLSRATTFLYYQF